MKPNPTDSWFVKKLIAMGACKDAIRYARKHRTFPEAWNSCDLAGWMGWLVWKLGFVRSYCPRYCCDGGALQRVRRHFPAARVSAALRRMKV